MECANCHSGRILYRRGLCRSCYYTTIEKAYRNKYKEKTREQQKKYYKNIINKIRVGTNETFRQVKRKRDRTFYKNNREKILKKCNGIWQFGNYKQGAVRRKLSWNISKNEFYELKKNPCKYCGESIKSRGLDRVDNSIGYEINNIVPCCKICNRMKMAQTVSGFIDHCKKIVKNQNK